MSQVDRAEDHSGFIENECNYIDGTLRYKRTENLPLQGKLAAHPETLYFEVKLKFPPELRYDIT